MSDLKIDSEFQTLISPMTVEEYRQLEENVINDGCQDPLIARNALIVNDLNQYSNLTPGARSILALKYENVIQKRARVNQRMHGVITIKNEFGKNSNQGRKPIETRKELAKIAGVSHDTIGRVKMIIEKGLPSQIERIKIGGKGNSVNAVYHEIIRK